MSCRNPQPSTTISTPAPVSARSAGSVSSNLSYNQALRDRVAEARKEVERYELENAQLRNFEAQAALNATQTALAQMELRSERNLTDRHIEASRKFEQQRDFYWESVDLIREMSEDALNKGLKLDPADVLRIVNRPDAEGVFNR
jgi:hypothetical protein